MPEPTELFKVIRTAIDQADHANPASFDTMASHIEFAVNNYFSDEGNEAEKVQRRRDAVQAACVSCFGTYGGAPARVAGELDAIIAKAQG